LPYSTSACGASTLRVPFRRIYLQPSLRITVRRGGLRKEESFSS
jgi:hypothetical protein